ncbi:MAG TPA: TRAP transporter large permease subunit [Gammaproteobacteria bacterium]|nr:TRAP transporter large permease subunit [Gammaproteobacteria bacterium]
MTQPETAPLRHRLEDGVCVVVFGLMGVLPLVEVVAREGFGMGLAGSIPIVQHMTLWISFLGAALAARTGRLLALSTGAFLPARWRSVAETMQAFVSVAVTTLLAFASAQLVGIDRTYGDIAAWGIPIWIFTAVMPIGFVLIAVRLALRASSTRIGAMIAALGCVVPLVFLFGLEPDNTALVSVLGVIIIAATLLGMPIYAALGGAALLLFWQEGTPISAVPGEAYRMSTSPMLPAIPLFTLAGYVLAAGGSSQRLLRLFSAAVGWMPGGLAVVVTLVLAFFTPLTGASGVTILAMGGVLLPMLMRSRYTEANALGLVTVSGSIGVLFPPSLPVILYAYYAEIDLDEMFIAGLIPGILLVVAVAAWAAWRGVAGGATRTTFDGRELGGALWHAKWDVLLPGVVLLGIFGGFATLVEAAALTVLYALVLECVVFKELPWREVVRVGVESAAMIGGFMIILSVALGLTNYLIIAQIPMQVLEWVRAAIESPYVFLLLLNLLLIVVGAAMDIYSAIIVVVPLIAPMAMVYGIHPVHLGIVFLANMQLGYLMPPMGENLFLSAYRFNKPLAELYRYVLPYVGIIAVVVLIITYVPAFTLWLLRAGGS